jgi:hypothetical protein
MVVFLPQLTTINIEIPRTLPVRRRAHAHAHARGASRMKDAIGKITGGVRCFAAPANVLLDTHEVRVSGDRRVPALVA